MFVFSDTIGSTSVPVCADTTDTRCGNDDDTRHEQSSQDDEAIHTDATYVVDKPLVARQPCIGSTGLTEACSRPGESGDWLTSDKTAPAKRFCAAREIDRVTATETDRCTQGRIYKMKVPPPSSILTTNSEPLMVSSGTSSGGPTTSSPINSQSLVVCPATSSPVNSQPLMVSSGTSSSGPTTSTLINSQPLMVSNGTSSSGQTTSSPVDSQSLVVCPATTSPINSQPLMVSSGTNSGGPTTSPVNSQPLMVSSGTSSGHTTTSIADRYCELVHLIHRYIIHELCYI